MQRNDIRQEWFDEEPDELAELLKGRGDLRIGQFLINAICYEYRDRMKELDEDHRVAAELILFNIEDDDLVEAAKNYNRR